MIHVILKIGGKYQLGSLNKKYKFTLKKEVKRLRDIDGEYEAMSSYLKGHPDFKYTEEEFLKMNSAERAYFLKEESNIEATFWYNYNKKCSNCVKECKQSGMVIVYRCSQYQKRKNAV